MLKGYLEEDFRVMTFCVALDIVVTGQRKEKNRLKTVGLNTQKENTENTQSTTHKTYPMENTAQNQTIRVSSTWERKVRIETKHITDTGKKVTEENKKYNLKTQ